MYLTVNTKSCATSHAKACENSTCVSSWPRGSRESLKYLDVLFVQCIETVFFGKWNFIGSLGHVECGNCTPCGKNSLRDEWSRTENIYLVYTPDSRCWRKSSSNLPDYFFFISKCLSKCCLHSRHEFSSHLCCHSYKNNNKESEIRRKLVLSIISRYKKFVGLAAPKWRQAMLESTVKNIIWRIKDHYVSSLMQHKSWIIVRQFNLRSEQFNRTERILH